MKMNAQTANMAYLIAVSNVLVRSFNSEPIVQCYSRSVLQAVSYQVLVKIIMFFKLSSIDTCMKPLECVNSAAIRLLTIRSVCRITYSLFYPIK